MGGNRLGGVTDFSKGNGLIRASSAQLVLLLQDRTNDMVLTFIEEIGRAREE